MTVQQRHRSDSFLLTPPEFLGNEQPRNALQAVKDWKGTKDKSWHLKALWRLPARHSPSSPTPLSELAGLSRAHTILEYIFLKSFTSDNVQKNALN